MPDITIHVPAPLLKDIRATARDLGTSTHHYITATLAQGHAMHLIQGNTRIKDTARIDPILAEAIHHNAQGKPWQHQAELLLATPALQPKTTPPSPATRHTATAETLLQRHKLPPNPPSPNKTTATLDGETLTGNQVLALLAIWEDTAGGWTTLTQQQIADHAGLPDRGIEPVLRRLVQRGILLARPNPRYYPHGTHRAPRTQYQIAPAHTPLPDHLTAA